VFAFYNRILTAAGVASAGWATVSPPPQERGGACGPEIGPHRSLVPEQSRWSIRAQLRPICLRALLPVVVHVVVVLAGRLFGRFRIPAA